MTPRDDLSATLRRERADVDRRLRRILRRRRGIPARLRAAMSHSLFGGGKRLRPVLLLWTYDALRTRRASRRDTALDAACAVELIHTYSLVHDDLPAMDDDVLRRGRPTCHVAFDEATAILAGDGLQALAFAILAGVPRHGAALAGLLADAAGPAGMVGGQQEDLDAEGRPLDAALIRRIHRDKTARLISAPMAAGALLAGAAPARREAVARAGLQLGMAFQAHDDWLDVAGDPDKLGKTAGKDARVGKATWVRLLGLRDARRRTVDYGRRGARMLERSLTASDAAMRLLALTRLLWERER
ncbi:polyprenyl synthetase family protein [bacterium]|nr:polyprenyl synthetase family protein [bacterium]